MQHQQSVTNPRVPYVGPVWKNLVPGSLIRIQGEVPPTADRFNINLHCGSPISDVAFHLSVRFLQNYVARNAMLDDSWGDEEDSGVLPILPGQGFEILILCDPACYKVAINGNHFCEFRHRTSFQKVTHVVIDGEVSLNLVAYEEGGPGASAPPPTYGGDADYFGPPRSPKPKPRRPPTPPQEEESGFEQFLETAGTIIAGAIATGAASTIIGSLTGHGHDHDHDQQQQQRYQRPPSPQPPGLQSLLFPGAGNHSPSHSQGGLGGAVGSIIGSVAEQILKPKEHH